MSVYDAYDPLAVVNNLTIGLFGPIGAVIYLLLFLFVYFALKVIITILVCSDKSNSIRVRLLKGRNMPIMPVCFCKEALKVWQTVVIYLVPVVLMHSALFVVSAISIKTNFIPLAMLVILSFFMAFDLTVVLYALFYKVTTGVDYISVDHHAYQMSTFNKSLRQSKWTKQKWKS
jgi:hypothetical protein